MKRPDWKFLSSNYFAKTHALVFNDKVLGVEKHICTKRDPTLFGSRERVFFRITGDEREYRTQEDMIAALRKKWEQMDRQRFSLLVHWGRQLEEV
jgi:hypothetical protein